MPSVVAVTYNSIGLHTWHSSPPCYFIENNLSRLYQNS